MQTLHTGKTVGSNPTVATMKIYIVQSRFDRWVRLPWVAIFEHREDAQKLVERMWEEVDSSYRERFPSWIWFDTIELDEYHHAVRYLK